MSYVVDAMGVGEPYWQHDANPIALNGMFSDMICRKELGIPRRP